MTVKVVQKEVGKIRSVGVIGPRNLGFQHADKVALLDRGYHIASGGAISTDQFVIDRLLDLGRSHEGTVYAAWKHYPGFPVKVRALVREFKEKGGSIIWGQAEGKEPAFVLKTAWLIRFVCKQQGCHIFDLLFDIASHGCSSGAVSELIYTRDCLTFYDRYEEKIWEMVMSFCDDTGLTLGQFIDTCNSPITDEYSFKVTLTWFAVEQAADRLACQCLPY